MCHGTIMTQTITFFPSHAAASAMANANGGMVEGFVVVPALGKPGKWVIQVWDTDEPGLLLGYL
jgi:hypothetical protein